MTEALLDGAEVERLTRRGLQLARFTVAYNIVEGAVAITAGLGAGLVSVVGFGIDSGIESAAAVLVGARLAARLRHGEADERKERLALKAVAVTFFVLAVYVTVEGVRGLVVGEAGVLEHRPPGEIVGEGQGLAAEGLRLGGGPVVDHALCP